MKPSVESRRSQNSLSGMKRQENTFSYFLEGLQASNRDLQCVSNDAGGQAHLAGKVAAALKETKPRRDRLVNPQVSSNLKQPSIGLRIYTRYHAVVLTLGTRTIRDR